MTIKVAHRIKKTNHGIKLMRNDHKSSTPHKRDEITFGETSAKRPATGLEISQDGNDWSSKIKFNKN
jgi:hypothetical protein